MLINLAYLVDWPTGTTAYALNLIPYLQRLSPTYLATPASKLDSCSPQYIPVPDNMAQGTVGHVRRLWWTQFQLPKHYCHSKCHSKLLFSPIPEAPLAISSRHSRSVVTFHDLIPLRFPATFGAIKYYYRHYVPQVLKQAQHIICNSEATARDITNFYGISARKITPILLAYDASHFRPVPAPANQLKDWLTNCPSGFDIADRPYFLTLGRHAPYKNIKTAIAAIKWLPNHRLLIAGPEDPRYTPDLKAFARDIGVSSQLEFVSYVPYAQLPALISGAIALVFPSLWEGFGLPVLEAMACGTPVIASKLASLPEVAGDAAYFVKNPADADEIGVAMKAIATTPGVNRQLSEAGLQQVRRFSWEETGKATGELLEKYL